MSNITIKEVPTNSSSSWWGSSKLFNDFLYFPYKLFKDDKMWVPPLLIDERTTLNKKKNPALEFCEYKMFIAYKDKEIVGRIIGMINNKANDIWKRKYIRFGWFDFIDDKEVADKIKISGRFDELSDEKKVEYITWLDEEFKALLNINQLFNDDTVLLMYGAHKDIRHILKKGKNEYCNILYKRLKEMLEGEEKQFKKYKVHWRAFKVLRPDLYKYPKTLAKECKLPLEK